MDEASVVPVLVLNSLHISNNIYDDVERYHTAERSLRWQSFSYGWRLPISAVSPSKEALNSLCWKLHQKLIPLPPFSVEKSKKNMRAAEEEADFASWLLLLGNGPQRRYCYLWRPDWSKQLSGWVSQSQIHAYQHRLNLMERAKRSSFQGLSWLHQTQSYHLFCSEFNFHFVCLIR